MSDFNLSVSKKVIIHSILVILALGISYFIAQTSISQYSLQIAGFVIAIYVLVSFLVRKRFLSVSSRIFFDIFIFSAAVSLLLFTTGGFNSPLFFLTYFLLFGIALLSNPATSIIAAAVFVLLFILSPKIDLWNEILQIASLLAIAPLSIVFGNQYTTILRDEQKIKVLKNVSQDFAEEIKVQEEEVKNWTDGEFRQKLSDIQKHLGNLLNDTEIDDSKKEKIKDLYKQIYELFLSGVKMKKEVGK